MKLPFQSNVWHLLRKNLSRGQLLGYVLANIVGLTVILVGILFYNDSRQSSDEGEQFFSNDYVVLSKRVDGIGFTPVGFSEEEIEQLTAASWVLKVGRFTCSRFAVSGSVSMGGKGLSSYLFFESVPDEFFDIKPKGWDFRPEERFVPIILSKDYLTLYNFGFAIPQGLPQVSEEVVGAIPITLRLTGRGMQTETLDAAIVGFSSRLNTIAVPQQFMDWANAHYAGTSPFAEPEQTSRLILRVDRSQAAAMHRYLKEHDYEMAGEQAEDGNISQFLSIVSVVVTTNGLVISLLALFILVLSIFLLLQKNRSMLRNLILLGYHPRYVARYYELLVWLINSLVSLCAVVVTLLLRTLWLPSLQEIGSGGSSPLPMLFIALVYFVGVTLFNVFIVRRHIRQISRQE